MEKLKTYKDIDLSIVDKHREFGYNKKLTEKLDNLESITRDSINEIILWKVNRYAWIEDDIIKLINDAKNHNSLDEIYSKQILNNLISIDGIRLPMASTILRFSNSSVYQIFDQRVYRFIYGKEIKLPYKNKKRGFEVEIVLYLNYLEKLHEVSKQLKIDFSVADRVLYQLDKHINKSIILNNY